MTIAFSIIIPIYNPKLNFLDECIDYIYPQLSKDDEIICVLNGNTKEQVNEIIKHLNKPQIVIQIEEEGDVATARNIGIEKAKNEYLLFVDYDDLVSPNILEISREILSTKNYDFVSYNQSEDFNLLGKDWNQHFELDKDSFLKAWQGKERELPIQFQRRSIQSKVFKRNIIIKNNIWYNRHQKLAQDTPFTFEYALNCETIYMCDNIMYYYRINDGTTTTKPNPKAVEYIDTLIENNMIVIERYNLGEAYIKELYFETLFNYFPYIFRRFIFDKRLKLANKEKKILIKKCCNKPFFKLAIEKTKYKQCYLKKQILFLYLLKHKLYRLVTLFYSRYKQ